MSQTISNSSLPNSDSTQYSGAGFQLKAKKLTQDQIKTLLNPVQDTLGDSLGVNDLEQSESSSDTYLISMNSFDVKKFFVL